MKSAQIARRFVASFFSVGDLILYGKYKNKKGRITAFGQDAKGNPTVTIEPVPKGRKQDKTMTLFKIWKVPLDKQAKGTDMSAKQVVIRYIKANGIERGRTVEVGDVRIHRYADLFKIWDLTNAGKRGKKVDGLVIQPSYYYKGNREEWMDRMSKALVDYPSLAKIKGFIKDLLVDSPKEIDMDDFQERGIDVNPGGTTKVTIETNTGLVIEAEPMSWRLLHRQEHKSPKGGTFFQDTNYHSRDRKSAGTFYNWLKANLGEANKMDLKAFIELWRSMGIQYDSQ